MYCFISGLAGDGRCEGRLCLRSVRFCKGILLNFIIKFYRGVGVGVVNEDFLAFSGKVSVCGGIG